MNIIEKLSYTYPEPEYEEVFKHITYPGIKEGKYAISNHGRVFNFSSKKIMKTYFDKDDHERITLVTKDKHPKKRGNKSKHYFIHRLMAWEFLGQPIDEFHNVVNHKNGIPCCNYIHNIEWCSVLENTEHAKRKGLLRNTGVDAKVCKYKEKLIRKICSLFEEGYNNIEIYEIIQNKKNYKDDNRIYQLINKLGKRICYRNIVVDYDYLPDMSYFKCDEKIQQMRNLIQDGKTNIEIMRFFGYNDYKDNKTFYNRIISERVKCEVLFNDYPKLKNRIGRNT